MKSSRMVVIVVGAIIAIFSGGAILGSYFPNASAYIAITGAAVGAVVLIFFGFTGHVVEKKVVETTKKPKAKKERKVEDEDPFEDISSGRR